jgi:hypothetical protein
MPRRKKRVKKEPKPPTWMVFKCFNQTKEEVCFGVTTYHKDYNGNVGILFREPQIAHWDLRNDKIITCRLRKPRRLATEAEAYRTAQSLERYYTHPRHFWVIQTGPNTLLKPRERKPVKPRRTYNYFDPNLEYDLEMELNLEPELVDEMA